MEHIALKAAITAATDQGQFTAVISAASIDREKDIVDPAGMVRALQRWVPIGKNIPLAWNHSTAPEHQIGYVDPKSARVEAGEVVVDGYIDQSADSGAHAWRQVKMGTLGFSFGYLVLQGGSTKLKGGGRHLKEFDVFEVTASPTPMNNDTRVLSWKAAQAVEDQEANELQAVIDLMGDFLDTEDDDQDIATARDILQRVQALLAAENAEAPDDGSDGDEGKSLQARAEAVALEHRLAGVDLKSTPVAPPQAAQDDASDLHALFPREEVKEALNGSLKAVWTTAYVNTLPDSAFLYVGDGGTKDSDGKTVPRSLRMFPYKDAAGTVDLPHLRNALARIPQSDLSQDVKDKLTAKAQRILADAQKSVDGAAQAQRRAADPLRAKAEALALEHASGGMSLQRPPRPVTTKAPDLLPLKELKERMRAEMLTALSGGADTP